MCCVLNIPRSTYYYESQACEEHNEIEELVTESFRRSRNNYGTRKIRKDLRTQGYQVSRRRIGRIMKKFGLISNYKISKYKVHKTPCNDSVTTNEVDRKFDNRDLSEVVVSDLTYVRVGQKWNYICILLDLHNREIIGFSVGTNKTAELVHQAFASVQRDLRQISIFHTDRGYEFKNRLIDELINTFSIKRSLSKRGCPYDNAVA